jgi:hypothetical protein
MTDDSPTQHELAEAEALARALDGGDAPAPVDALEVAALLRYARGQDQASAASLAHARSAALHALPRRRGPLRMRTLAVALAAAAAIALVYLPSALLLRAPSAEAPVQAPAGSVARAPARRPLPSLLEAQAQALAQPDAPLDALVAASAAQRRQLWSELARRYGAAP